MPFKPGESGNPAGRPQTNKFVIELARKHTEEAIAKLAELMRLDDPDSRATQVAAAKALLDRAWGTPPQAVTISGDQENPLFNFIDAPPKETREQWEKRIAAKIQNVDPTTRPPG